VSDAILWSQRGYTMATPRRVSGCYAMYPDVAENSGKRNAR
jgi:hypothetical protein